MFFLVIFGTLLTLMVGLGQERSVMAAPYQARPVFLAVLDSYHPKRLDFGQNIIPQSVELNDGNGYDSTSGVFTAPIPGTYAFSAHFVSHGDNEISISLMKNQNNIVNGYTKGEGQTGSLSAVLKLTRGDRVFLQNNVQTSGAIYGMRYSSFSGYLI